MGMKPMLEENADE
jgi:hypothetical protein